MTTISPVGCRLTAARLEFLATPLVGLLVVQRRPIEDARGFLSRVYSREQLTPAGMQKPLVQINHTLTRQAGTVRGLHFQRAPHAEAKLVSCLRGEVFDVAVDVRRHSPTFLQWHGEVLSAANHRSLLIPEGFAHGFQALADDCELLYLHTAAYESAAEGGLHPGDPRLAITWPLDIANLSERDRTLPTTDAFDGLDV